MATHQQNQAPPPDFPADGESQISEIAKPVSEVKQPTIAQETYKQDPPASVFKNSEPIREDQIQNAIKFLSHPRVKGSPVIHRRSFLERKGLTKEEIDEAFRRVPDPPPSSQTTVNSQDGQQAVSNVQPQGQIQAIQPAQAPVAMIPPPSFLSRFRWYHAALAVGVLAASGAGTAVFVKKSLIPRLKSWVRRIMLEEEEEADPLKKVDGKPSLAEEAVAAAKAASDVARVSQEMMKTKNDEMKYFEDLTNLLGVQVQEMKSLSNNFRRLEGRSKNPPKVYSAEQEGYGGSITTATERRPYANGSNTDYDTRSARSASPPAPPPAPPSDSSAPPHPKSYMDIMSMIQRGEKPSNIREINDMPPNPNQQLSSSRIAPKTKPWDSGQAPQEDGSNGSWWQQKNPRSTDFGYETTVARSVGIQNETTTMEPAAFQRQKSWVPPQPPPVVMPEAAEAIRRPKPQAKIDQEAAASDDQSGVSDELQKVTKFSESGGDGSERSQISEIQEETEQQQMNHEGN
ncbi:unnamed protein product [Cochlearia groenlandica]